MVLRLVYGLPPPDAPAAVGTALLPVPLCLGVLPGRLLALRAVQPPVPDWDMRGLRHARQRSAGATAGCATARQYRAGPSPSDTGPLHFRELGHAATSCSSPACSPSAGTTAARNPPGPRPRRRQDAAA